MSKHIWNHCPTVKALRKAGQAGQITEQLVTEQIQRYVSMVKVTTAAADCACVYQGTRFCERIVSQINWNMPIVYYTIHEGNRRLCYVR